MLAAAVLAAPLAVGLLRGYQLRRLDNCPVGAQKVDSGAGWAVRQ
jgi:hypothetical protein